MNKAKVKLIRPTDAEEREIQRGIAADADNPEWTKQDFAAAKPLSQVMAERKRMGRPLKERPKVPLNLRVDPDVVDAFRATGDGWQTRMNDALVTFLKEHSL